MGMKKNEILKVQYVNNWSPFRGKKKKKKWGAADCC